MSPNIGFRLASAEDADTVQALVQSAYRGESSRAGWTTEAGLLEGVRIGVAEVVAVIDGEDSCVLLATDEQDEIVACVALHQRSPRLAYLGMFAVRPGLQGRGVGRIVIEQAQRFVAERWDVTQLEMTVIGQRTELIAWYERLGYRRTGQTRPFPTELAGRALRDDLYFVVLDRSLVAPPG